VTLISAGLAEPVVEMLSHLPPGGLVTEAVALKLTDVPVLES